MDQLYERPREKIQNRGAGFLTNVELLQAILGSGSSQFSAARLARNILKSMSEAPISYVSLLQIQGLGHAKACQVLAALEFGARVSHDNSRVPSSISSDTIMQAIGRLRRFTMVHCFILGGDKKLLKVTIYRFQEQMLPSIVGAILSDAVVLGARYLSVVLAAHNHNVTLTTSELKLIRELKASALSLNITIESTFIANSVGINNIANPLHG